MDQRHVIGQNIVGAELCRAVEDGLVLAHSKSEHGVKKVDAAMTVFNEPVTWENGKFVRVIVTIAAEDQTRHIRILNDILDVFSKKEASSRSLLSAHLQKCEAIYKNSWVQSPQVLLSKEKNSGSITRSGIFLLC